MNKGKNKAIGVLLCFGVAVSYIIILKLLGLAEYLLFGAVWDYSLVGVITQSLATTVIFIPLILFHKTYVFKEKGIGLLRGFGVAGFYVACFLILFFSAFQQTVVNYAKGYKFLPFNRILEFVISMFLVGLSEEMLFRGVILNVLKDYFGAESRKGIVLSVIWSGVIFGSMHISNYFSGVSLSGAIFQSIAAIGIGCYFGAVYVRTNNLWILVILHGLNDLFLDVDGGLFGIGSLMDDVSEYGPTTFVTLALYAAITWFLLRRKKITEMLSKERQ